ncbi:helix-turn-helix transcriptional regulator [Nonomuraea fastidiosa]|jgi:transcriptional regulator with XRE-family HTH domain|uniref:helix-turn-helix transcriptional regulator n=1 Tax=Nonomuraea TaxID=83681 RepID=UPI00344108F8
MPESTGRALGDFLRSRRERLTPEAVGLPPRPRRRAPGLRREEVAERAGIGIDWYVRLEQGRAVTPSLTTIDALAAALCLDETEHAHLRTLARHPTRPAFTREQAPEGTARLVHSLDRPAYVTGRRWDILTANTAATALFTGLDRLPADDRNVLVYLLLTPMAREVFGETWAAQARHTTAQFRAAYDLQAPDAAFTTLADRLRHGSPEFRRWWKEHDVASGGAGRKMLHGHAYDYATFQTNEDPALRLTVCTPR